MGGKLFGHPWHGIWRQATGMVTAPDGHDYPLHGQPPAGGASGTDYGLVFPIKTGRPPVTVPDVDKVAGETWMDFGLVTGGAGRVYGLGLGAGRWLLCDAANDHKMWCCWLDQFWYTGGVLSGRLVMRSFGDFGGHESVLVADWTFSPDLSGAQYANKYDHTMGAAAIEDISSDGHKVLIAIYTSDQLSGDVVSARSLTSIAELSITISEGAAAVGAREVKRLADIHHRYQFTETTSYLHAYVGTYQGKAYLFTQVNDDDGWSFPPAVTQQYAQIALWSDRISMTSETGNETIVGARYNPNDGVDILSLRYSGSSAMTRTITPTVTGMGQGWTRDGTGSGTSASTVSILLNGQVVESLQLTGQITQSFSRQTNNVQTTYTIGDVQYTFTSSYTRLPGSSDPIDVSDAPQAANQNVSDGAYVVQSLNGGSDFRLSVRRWTNTVFGLHGYIRPGGHVAEAWHFFNLHGRQGVTNDPMIVCHGAAECPIYVVESPISGEVIRSETPIGFV